MKRFFYEKNPSISECYLLKRRNCFQLSKLFPKWLKLAITSRHFDVRYRRMLEQYFIIHQLDRGSTELLKFIETRLPNIDSSVMLEACQVILSFIALHFYSL